MTLGQTLLKSYLILRAGLLNEYTLFLVLNYFLLNYISPIVYDFYLSHCYYPLQISDAPPKNLHRFFQGFELCRSQDIGQLRVHQRIAAVSVCNLHLNHLC